MSNTIGQFWGNLKRQTIKNVDKIFGKKYNVWVINSKSVVSLYLWENWKRLYPEINGIVSLVNSQTYIRTFQSFEFEHKWLGFGRMSWTEKNNEKWASKYRTAEYEDNNIEFFGTEIWSPDWNYCWQTGDTPEIFIKVYDYSKIIGEGIIIALPKRTTKNNEKLVLDVIKSIQLKIPDATLSRIERYWTPSYGFWNSIEDLNPLEIERIILNKPIV